MLRFTALLFLFLPQLAAQTASLRGQVTDETGAIVPGAKVSLNGPNRQSKTTTAAPSGAYSFTGLAPGSYSVTASAPGLELAAPSTIQLDSSAQTLNLQLKVVAVTEKVTVRENAGPMVSTDASNNASALVLQGSDLDALSDNPDDLAADLQALAGPSAGPNGGSIFIDGFSGGELPPKQSIREIRINQNPFSPEYDKLGYGRIEIFTKPGADRFRGTVDYNLGTKWWNSRNPFASEKAPFLLQEFEGNTAGPLGKRASFTLDAQRNMVDNGSIVNAVTLDPRTFAILPFNGFVTSPQRFLRVSPRVDYQLNPNNTLIVRYTVTHGSIPESGIGAFNLSTQGYLNQYTNQTVQATETAVIGTAVNETRFQYFRSAIQFTPNVAGPETQVLGSFNGGGSPVGHSSDTQNNFELQNYTSILRGAHSWRFGVRLRGQVDASTASQNFNGTFTFGGGQVEPVLDANNNPTSQLAPITSIERYRRTLLFEQLGYSPAQIRALGGGATQFSINAGTPALTVHQIDAGFFAGDEWRMRANLTLSLGLRYETQSNIHDWKDFAPRIALAWAPGGSAKKSGKTVLRAGFGMFYDRFPLTNTLTAQRFNGVTQQQYVVANPDFFPTLPSPATLAGFASTQVIQEVSSRLRAPYLMQSAFTLERQLPANTTLAMTYTNSHGVHQFRSEDINAPLPATGALPLNRQGPVFLMESAGIYNQNQVIANVNSKLNAGFSLFGFYVFNRARSNTDGINTFPANPYNFSGEYGPASTDIHHRMTVGGSVNFRWNIRISPFVIVQSGMPFDITAGSDLYGDTLFNGRPGIATNSTKPGLIQTSYGLLDPNPTPGEPIIGRNAGRGPAIITTNIRVAKSIGFGPERGNRPIAQRDGGGNPGNPGGGGGGGGNPAMGGGMGRVIGTPSTSRRYNLTISMSVRNLLNHTNPGPLIGNITSPLFGMANQIAGAPNGEGFSELASNRRLELQLRFTF